MANKPLRPLTNTLRVMIAGGSVAAFVGGWAFLAHAPIASEQNTSPASDSVPDSDAPAPLLRPSQNNTLPGLQALPTPRRRSSLPQLQPNTQPSGQSNQPFFGQRQRRLRSGGS